MEEATTAMLHGAGNKVVALVQARMGSTRLPGKMLMDLRGYPILHWVLSRSKQAKKLDQVVLATSALDRDDPLEALAKSLRVACFRGSESDVLGRFAEAARVYNADIVVRICADNPLTAPEEIDRLVDFYLDALRCGTSRERLYAFNHIPTAENHCPDGLGAEILSRTILQRMADTAASVAHREHVNDFILDHPDEFDIRAVPVLPELAYPQIKLDVDTQEDLQKLRRLCQGLDLNCTAHEIVREYLADLRTGEQ